MGSKGGLRKSVEYEIDLAAKTSEQLQIGKEMLTKLRRENFPRYKTMIISLLCINIDEGLSSEQIDRVASTALPASEAPRSRSDTPPRFGNGAGRAARRKSADDLDLDDGRLFGAALTQEGIAAAEQLVQHLRRGDVIGTEGLFRMQGGNARVLRLRAEFCAGRTIDLAPFIAHDVATVLKAFLRELPSPLLTDEHYPVYCQLSDFARTDALSVDWRRRADEKRVDAIRLLLLLLPPERAELVNMLVQLLAAVARHCQSNKMDAFNLGTVFVPVLLRQPHSGDEAVRNDNLARLLALVVERASTLFDPPAALVDQVIEHFTKGGAFLDVCERPTAAATRSPERLLSPFGRRPKATRGAATAGDESLEARSTVAFVDRARSAVDEQLINTDTAMANLYAQVQGMPDGKQKERYVKLMQKQQYQSMGMTPDGSRLKRKGAIITQLQRTIRKHFVSTIRRSKSADLDEQDSENTSDPDTTVSTVGSSSYLLRSLASKSTILSAEASSLFDYSGLPEATVDLDDAALIPSGKAASLALQATPTPLTAAFAAATDSVKDQLLTPRNRTPLSLQQKEHLI